MSVPLSYVKEANFEQALPLLQSLIQKNPTNSEYHRYLVRYILAKGDQEKAIDCLIDALRWDSKNTYALLMYGNILPSIGMILTRQ